MTECTLKEISPIELLRVKCSTDILYFTRYFFKKRFKRKFIIGKHHLLIADALNKVYQGEITRLIINIAPRYSKTELAVKNFIACGFAINPSAKFIHLSYSDDLARNNSQEVMEIMNTPEYQELFNVKPNSRSSKMWNTNANGGLYAVSSAGQVTGFGAGLVEDEKSLNDSIEDLEQNTKQDTFGGAIIIDDPLKPDDALSDLIRNKINLKFETTIRNRVNSRKTPIIIIMQRLHEHDLCGYLQEIEPDDWTVLSIPCIQYDEQGNEQALWEFKHTIEELHKIEQANDFVFQTQYMQNPTPLQGLLYREFKTYDSIALLPKDNKGRNCIYVDSADTGDDYHCAIAYIERPEANYITDILFTKKPMEYTEPALVKMIHDNNTRYCYIESNNGGRIYRRNVERLCREAGYDKVQFVDISQTENKQVRLFTKANEVNNLTIFPNGWERVWNEFAIQIKHFRKEGRNLHDDGADALTGTIEMRNKNKVDSKRMAEIFGL